MKKFLLLYMSPMSTEEMMKMGNDEQRNKGMDMWKMWFQKAGSAIVDMGSPTGNDTHMTKMGAGQHMGDYVGGYTIVQAEDMEGVKAMLSEHPHFMQEGNSIEILEILPMPGAM